MIDLSRSEPFPDHLNRLADRAWIVGVIALIPSLALLFVPQTRGLMYPAYLIGFVYWFGIAMGGASLAMLHHLTGGSWGLLVRRPMEAAALVILPLAILFVPIALGLDVLYPWARQFGSEDMYAEAIRKKTVYLNTTGFLARAVGYFIVWGTLAVVLSRLSRAQDRATDRGPTVWLRRISPLGLGLVFLTGSFAGIDWLMSLEPEWASSIYPAMLITGWGLATWAAMILVAGSLRRTAPMETVATPSRFQDLGNLTFAFIMLWAYTSFMQYLIIWSGNLPEEIIWYLRRSRGGWQYFAFALVLFHFFAPFFILLGRGIKRRAPRLMTMALVILLMHLVDGIWLVLPSRVRNPLSPAIGVSWVQVLLSILATIGIGGVCVGCFFLFLKQAPLVPQNDPAGDALEHDVQEESEDAAVQHLVGGA